MRRTSLSVSLILLLAGIAQAQTEATFPAGPLPGTVKPKTYRLSLTIDPAQQGIHRAHGDRCSTDAACAQHLPARQRTASQRRECAVETRNHRGELYGTAEHRAWRGSICPKSLPAGDITLTFDYTADFRTGAEGLFHAEVGGRWYAWTQMEPIDARRMFPGFDEPGFKTPFTVTVTAPKDLKVFANAPLAEATPAGAMTTHRFAHDASRCLPIWWRSASVRSMSSKPACRRTRCASSRSPCASSRPSGQASRMQFAAREAPKLVELTEKYVGIPFPYAKLDLLASPMLGGAMENAGLIIFDDTLLLLDNDAPFRQLRAFAEVTAHEIAHQWFGDLVTPAWWTDIWLNESFAEWLGKKIGDQWRPDLGIATSGIQDAFEGMEADSLGGGPSDPPDDHREPPDRQRFRQHHLQEGRPGAVDVRDLSRRRRSSRKGVNLHLQRYRHGNATRGRFLPLAGRGCAEIPKVVDAMRTFTDQTGVPMVTVTENARDISLAQTRYRPLGVRRAGRGADLADSGVPRARREPQSATCCKARSATIPAFAGEERAHAERGRRGLLPIPLDDAGLGSADRRGRRRLPGREALAFADSLWADFAAGTGSFRARHRGRARAQHASGTPGGDRAFGTARGPCENDADGGSAAAVLEAHALHLRPEAGGAGLRPEGGGARAGVSRMHSRCASRSCRWWRSRAGTRSSREQLAAAADAYLGGDTQALDPAFRATALQVAVQDRGAPFMKRLQEAMLKSTDSLFRQTAPSRSAERTRPELAQRSDRASRSRPACSRWKPCACSSRSPAQPKAREALAVGGGSQLQAAAGCVSRVCCARASSRCSAGTAQRATSRASNDWIQPNLAQLGGGELELAQTKERIALCAALKSAKQAEIARALAN